MGMPLSVVLVKQELDVLAPGQHNGTFRGNNLAFVAGTAALEMWRKPSFEAGIQEIAGRLHGRISDIVDQHPGHGAHVRGRGLLSGIGWSNASIAGRVSKEAYARGLIVETSGAEGQVLKLMPPLTITPQELDAGLAIVEEAIACVVEAAPPPQHHHTIPEHASPNASM